MRFRKAMSILIAVLATVFLLASFFDTYSTLQAHATERAEPARLNDAPADSGNDRPTIRSTRLISIPYGFDSPLPLTPSGEEVVVSGPGACTDGEEVTVEVSISQSAIGAQADGEWTGTCTGQSQPWSLVAVVYTGAALTSGEAEACGTTTTRSGGEITDTFEWCADVELTTVQPRIYVPLSSSP